MATALGKPARKLRVLILCATTGCSVGLACSSTSSSLSLSLFAFCLSSPIVAAPLRSLFKPSGESD